MAKKTNLLKVIRKIRRVEFWYDDEFYIYEFSSESNTGLTYIWKGDERDMIYGPYIQNPTPIAIKIYEAVMKEIYPSEPKN